MKYIEILAKMQCPVSDLKIKKKKKLWKKGQPLSRELQCKRLNSPSSHGLHMMVSRYICSVCMNHPFDIWECSFGVWVNNRVSYQFLSFNEGILLGWVEGKDPEILKRQINFALFH